MLRSGDGVAGFWVKFCVLCAALVDGVAAAFAGYSGAFAQAPDCYCYVLVRREALAGIQPCGQMMLAPGWFI